MNARFTWNVLEEWLWLGVFFCACLLFLFINTEFFSRVKIFEYSAELRLG